MLPKASLALALTVVVATATASSELLGEQEACNMEPALNDVNSRSLFQRQLSGISAQRRSIDREELDADADSNEQGMLVDPRADVPAVRSMAHSLIASFQHTRMRIAHTLSGAALNAAVSHWGQDYMKMSVKQEAIAAGIQVLFVIIFAFLYTKWKPETAVPSPEPARGAVAIEPAFKVSLFGCFEAQVADCLCGCFCCELRWADTMRLAGLLKFWTAVIAIGALLSFSELTRSITGVVALVIVIWQRQALRKNFGVQSGGCTLVADCFAYVFCPCCAAIQEARLVETVPMKQGDRQLPRPLAFY